MLRRPPRSTLLPYTRLSGSSPAELKTLQPHVNVDDVGAAAYEPASGYASPADVVEGFRRQAQARGARILQWTPATRIVRRSEEHTAELQSQSKLVCRLLRRK